MSELFTEIERPTLLLNEATARRNIQHMSGKAAESSVRFRPHFKTHQSASIGFFNFRSYSSRDMVSFRDKDNLSR